MDRSMSASSSCLCPDNSSIPRISSGIASSGLLSLSSSSRPIFCSRSRRDSRFTCSMYSAIFAGVRVRSISSMT